MAEVLIAVSILAIVTTLVYGSFSRTFETRAFVAQVQERYHGVRTALERMSREISMAFIYDCRDIDTPTGERRYWTVFKLKDEGDYDRLTFASFSNLRMVRDVNESDQNELSYFTEQDAEESDVTNIMRREKKRIDGEPDQVGPARVLCHDVEKLQFEAWDEENKEWVREWDCTQIERQNRLPKMVRVQLTIENEFGEEMTFSSVSRIFANKPLSAWMKGS